MSNTLRRSIIAATCALSLSTLGHAQSSPIPYSSSSTIQGEPLDSERARSLAEFLKRPFKNQTHAALGQNFCRPVVTQPTPSADQVKLALALVEAEITPVLSFETHPSNEQERSATVRYSIDFGLDTVTLRSSNARYQSQAAGLQVAYPHDVTRPVWFEGKGDTSILFLVPPVRDCNVQFVVACPRAYSNSRTLEQSKLSLAGVNYLTAVKADGLFKAPAEQEGKVLAAALASSRVTLPSTWSSENLSADSPSASFKIKKPVDTLDSKETFTAISLPTVDSVEARLEFGSASTVKRVVRSRATAELSSFTLESSQPVRIERSDIPLSAGSCIVISRRRETHYG